VSERLDDNELTSLHQWIASWGDGPNWSDKTGELVPTAKTTLVRLVDECVRLREVIRDARNRVLDHRPNRIDQLFKANLAALLDHALDDNRDGYFTRTRAASLIPTLTPDEVQDLSDARLFFVIAKEMAEKSGSIKGIESASRIMTTLTRIIGDAQ